MKRRGGRRPQQKIILPDIRANNRINAENVLLLDEEGSSLGVVPTKDALEESQKRDLDLVEIAPQAKPPVCKIMNFSRHLFELKKRKAEAKKNQKKIIHKSIKFRPNTDTGDYDVKLRKITEFIERGNHVKILVWFRGRELMHHDLGERLLERIKNDLKDKVTVQSDAKLEGRQMIMVLCPLIK